MSKSEPRDAILFVDDDPRLIRTLQRSFTRDRARWEMVFCIGGRAALDELRTRRFHALVTDLDMPDVGGREVIEAARDASPTIACIIVSGAVITPGAFPGCEILAKPVPVEMLRTTLEAALARS